MGCAQERKGMSCWCNVDWSGGAVGCGFKEQCIVVKMQVGITFGAQQ